MLIHEEKSAEAEGVAGYSFLHRREMQYVPAAELQDVGCPIMNAIPLAKEGLATKSVLFLLEKGREWNAH